LIDIKKRKTMKKIGKILVTFILFFCVTNILQAQDVLEMINTPEALRLREELDAVLMKQRALEQKYSPLHKRYYGTVINDLSKLDSLISNTGDVSNLVYRRKQLETERDSLKRLRDSIRTHEIEPLSDKGIKLERKYVTEITKSKEPQAILKKMKEANGNGDRALAQNILKDYTESLLTNMREKFRLRKIDKYEMKAEHDAIIKLNEALTRLAFPPRTVIN